MDVIQLVLQGSALGILAYWMIFVLPTERKDMLIVFKGEMKIERDTCEKRHAENLAQHSETQLGVKDTRHAVNNIVNQMATTNELLKIVKVKKLET